MTIGGISMTSTIFNAVVPKFFVCADHLKQFDGSRNTKDN